jgi:hypothetical protein
MEVCYIALPSREPDKQEKTQGTPGLNLNLWGSSKSCYGGGKSCAVTLYQFLTFLCTFWVTLQLLVAHIIVSSMRGHYFELAYWSKGSKGTEKSDGVSGVKCHVLKWKQLIG